MLSLDPPLTVCFLEVIGLYHAAIILIFGELFIIMAHTSQDEIVRERMIARMIIDDRMIYMFEYGELLFHVKTFSLMLFSVHIDSFFKIRNIEGACSAI